MPVIKSAKKKLRQDKKRTAHNSAFEEAYKKAVKAAKKTPTAESVRLATKATDKAVKHHLVNKNKAARVKSSLAKLIAGKTSSVQAAPKANAPKKVAKPAAKKAPVKSSKKSAKK